MENVLEIVRNDQYETSQWSGGSTTEILIYPKASKYSERNFKYRISSAKVQVEESSFTSLPGVSRHLMLTTGNMTLEHENKYKITLKPFEQDQFLGDWTTKSFGKATDFNLMLREGCTGNLNLLTLKAGEKLDLTLEANADDIFYIFDGCLELAFDSHSLMLNQKDLFHKMDLFYDKEYKVALINKSDKDINIIKTHINY